MRVLVTGATGCVGQALRSVSGDYHEHDWMFLCGRQDCDLSNREQTIDVFQDKRPDCVVHLAAYVPGFYDMDRVRAFSENVRINENVLEAANLANVKCGVFCLSASALPETPSRLPIDETMLFEGQPSANVAGYGQAKRMLALQCGAYNEQYKRRYTCMVPCNIYGPYDNLKSGRLIPNIISKFFDSMSAGTDVKINGTGKPLRQLIFSEDVARIIVRLLNSEDINVVNCCVEDERSIADISMLIGQLIAFEGRVIFDDTMKDGVLRRTMCCKHLNQVLKHDTSWITSLENGLSKTIDWYRTQRNK